MKIVHMYKLTLKHNKYNVQMLNHGVEDKIYYNIELNKRVLLIIKKKNSLYSALTLILKELSISSLQTNTFHSSLLVTLQ